MLMHHEHPTSVVHIRVCSWWCIVYGFRKCTATYIHYYSIIQSCFTALKILCVLSEEDDSPLTPSNHQFFYCLKSFAFSRCHAVGIWKVFSNWLLWVSNMHLSFFHVFSWFDSSLWLFFFFFFNADSALSGCITVYLFFIYWRSSCYFQVLAAMNKAAVNILVQVFMRT